MVTVIATIHEYLFVGVAVLLTFQSILLFIRSKNNKVRLTLAIIELLWALVYIIGVAFIFQPKNPDEFAILREKVMILGSFYVCFMLFFLMQVLIPGWLNWKRIFLVLSPMFVLSGVYYGILFLLGEPTENLHTYEMLANSLGHFNVWFRFVILFSNFAYIISMLKWLSGFKKKYIQWQNENFADQEYVDISWMRPYYFIIIGISVFYMGVLFFGGRIPIICHGVFVICSISYLFYNTLFYESPYPEDFFAKDNVGVAESEVKEHQPVITGKTDSINESTFDRRIPEYVATIRKWMEEEKPYLYNDFKLTDVYRVVPLNRSYLSRIFNEGFGTSFSEVVRSYRISYAKMLIRRYATQPMTKIAEMSGFSSDSTFIRVFKQETGQTPVEFKNSTMEEKSKL